MISEKDKEKIIYGGISEPFAYTPKLEVYPNHSDILVPLYEIARKETLK
ncbi:MAG: hypothetical protein ACP5EQ_08100 [Candidatus Cloacimonadia bacterium]